MDTRRWVGSCVMSMAIGTAWATGDAAQDAKGTAADKGPASGQVTLSGCLEGPINTGDEYALSFEPEPIRGAGVTRFRLTNVTMQPMPAKDAMYVIVGDDEQLSAQLGRQVRIVGTIVLRWARNAR